MGEPSRNSFEIIRRSEDNTEFHVRFDSLEEVLEAIDELSTAIAAYELRHFIYRLREICQTSDEMIFYPQSDIDLPKARWITVTAAASFPRGVSISSIQENSDLKAKEVHAYCTSKNNPSSKYLYIVKGIMHIKSEGIMWVIGLLEKDGQIEMDNERATE